MKQRNNTSSLILSALLVLAFISASSISTFSVSTTFFVGVAGDVASEQAESAEAESEEAVDDEDEIEVDELDDDEDEHVIASVNINLGYKSEQHKARLKKEEPESGEDDDGEEDSEDDEVSSTPISQAFVYKGEDAAIGAFRFAETHSGYYDTVSMPISIVMEAAQQLNEALSESANYTPPEELTKCGSGGKKKTCTAGKLWKRAEDLRKSELHDAAGADLIRALLKSGLEVDFVDKCHKSLQWTLSGVRRQRERERKEAEEERKLELRREEERKAMIEAEKRREGYEKDFERFAEGIQKDLAEGSSVSVSIGSDGTVQTDELDEETKNIIYKIQKLFVASVSTVGVGNHSEILALLKKLPFSSKSVEILLIEARTHELLGNYKSALSAAGKVIQKATSHDPWIDGTPRMMAATLGASAAMQLGLADNALSFYQNVLKFDPEQSTARIQYRGLKKVLKLLDKADEQIKKGYNKKASEIVEDCLSAMRGLDVENSPLFRSRVQLKQCAILSGMGKFEEALEYCDSAVDARLNTEHSHDVVSSQMKKEAHLVRAEALMSDMDYDEAVNDFRAAFDLVPEDRSDPDLMNEKRELQQKLQNAMHQQDSWNGGKKDHRFNEHTGYPDGRPPQRDHAKILQLPIDLEERPQDIKCAWLKKQFKVLVKKYHPDKYKGNKKRAARKFKEVKEAKEIISKEWDC